MANIYEGMNVRQKLAKARLQFLNQKVKKSGKNMHLEFKYFELEDIVPPAIRIFARVGLTTDIDFTDENGAVMRVYNTDKRWYFQLVHQMMALHSIFLAEVFLHRFPLLRLAFST